MDTEERDESQPRPRKVIPSIRRENTDQEGGRRPYNQGYQPEGNYERRPYNRQPRDERGGGYNRSYGNNQSTYGNQNRMRSYDNRDGGYGNRGSYGNNTRGGYGNQGGGYNRPSYGNNRPSYGNQYEGGGRPQYNNDSDRPYSSSPSGDSYGNDGLKKRRPRVGDTRPNTYDNRGTGGRPSYGNRQGGYGNNSGYGNNGGGYGNNRRPMNNNRRPGGGGGNYNPNAKYSFQKQLKYKEVLADPNEPIRLNKFLSNAGVCSRREADEFIQAGAVKVNGEVVTELGTKITRQDQVIFHDQPVQIESKVYIVLNKPRNCVTTSDDPKDRRTVMDLVKHACTERIYPVGRLDRNTTGVLLLTNDGDLASKLTHPSFKKKKIYHVWLDKNVAIEDMEKIANGLELEDGEIHADAISYASEYDKSQVGIEIHSGRNRIVRRIFESLGYHVVKLDRVYFAGLTKKNLSRGKWRYLNEREVNALRMGAFE
ncbi:pseudouridine synthase [Parabacteroides sp. PF5-9]|uniref:pseudouridine synthase n=1 Tax=Parabacteroides sp. PF5-9 TaxID=1742404 RepID=UPI002476F39D|nr:pseudouridine synthase [Parabacteroides sp. PF5-9]MDH6358097.1 23S rRNA pseudouridine2605 synthase [Parabacteroides sp. PF5-9]